MENTHILTEKWAKVLDLESAPKIADAHRRAVTATLLENQLASMKSDAMNGAPKMLSEAAPVNNSGIQGDVYGAVNADGSNGNPHMAGYDPVLINLVRRAMPQMIAFDVCGVQPMTQPTGLIFAMKSKYRKQGGQEALYNEAWTGFAGEGKHAGSNWAEALKDEVDPKTQNPVLDLEKYSTGFGMTTAEAEARGSEAENQWNEMAFSIEKTSVVAKSRILKAEYTLELAQDLKSVHGLDAEAELSNILATEILAEINREVIRDIYVTAEWGCQNGTARKGIFDLDIDSDGRWSAEKYKGLMYRIEREANAIAQKTRRGRGNFIICSSDVASALQMAGMLDYAPAVQNALKIDEAQSTFAGILNGKYKVFIDPYTANQSEAQYCVVGYKGTSAYDAGMFYCPYVPLQLIRAQDPNTFQPKIGFKTRYGIAFNPQVQIDAKKGVGGDVSIKDMAGANYYYRKFIVNSL
jgi:hypothetical protein